MPASLTCPMPLTRSKSSTVTNGRRDRALTKERAIPDESPSFHCKDHSSSVLRLPVYVPPPLLLLLLLLELLPAETAAVRTAAG